MATSVLADESRVLVIYTGGTIGMLVGDDGFVPEPFFLTESLKKEPRFHDPDNNSLFSNVSSVRHFRQWSSTSPSGPSTPTGTHSPSSTTPPRSQSPLSPSTPTLLVRSSRPIAQPPAYTGSNLHFTWKLSDDCYEAHLPSLITPRSSAHGGNTKRIRYAVLEWHPLLDSSNMEFSDWIRIATDIELNYKLYDAFVILHGTDTMGYTSSALSFLLEDLGKTVIITGAQIPLSQLRNDAVDNLLGALSIAGQFCIPEVCLYFNHTLFRGNRVTKSSSYDLDAFSSPNFPPLVNVGIDVVVNWNHVIRPTTQKKFRAHKVLSSNVVPLRIFPGITAATVRAFLAPHIQGVVLESFGAGNAPKRRDLMDALKEACDRGVVIVTISQCARGSVSDAYETGRALLSVGVVPGEDMTPQCALTKLAYLLSKPELSVAQVRRLIRSPLRGELSGPPTIDTSFSSSDRATNGQGVSLESIGQVLTQFLRISSSSAPAASLSNSLPPPINIVSAASAETPTEPPFSLATAVGNSTAPWSITASHAASTESALLPFLIHLAASRDDVDGIKFCIQADENIFNAIAGGGRSGGFTTPGSMQVQTVPRGVVNCLDSATQMSPLHVAALSGSVHATEALLAAGALVHPRDILDHTALYYAARQGHEQIVKMLNQAGAHLGGADLAQGFVQLALKKAAELGETKALHIWKQAGVDIDVELKSG